MGEISTTEDAGGPQRRGWKQDPDAVRRNIVQVARGVFARQGLSGARVEEIAASTRTSKRMIYYYFGDKEGLYRAVLEDAYGRMRGDEAALDLRAVHPVAALRQLAEFTFEHHRRDPDFVRLVMIENIHEGAHMSSSDSMTGQNSSVILLLEDIYQRGCEAGLFRSGLTALELHWHISALSIFNIANRATFSRIFGDALFTERGQRMLSRHVGDMILGLVMKPGLSSETDPQRPKEEARMINPDIFRFLDVWDAKWATLAPEADAAARRTHFESIARDMRLPTPPEVETDDEHWIDSSGGPVRVRVFRHAAGGTQPALIYMHGGGWMQGSPETHWDITARLAAWTRCTVISVDYALAPEHPFPAAYEQVLSVAKWAHAEAEALRIDPARIAIGGDSAGGNLAAAVALTCRDESVPLSAQLLIYPACDFDQSRPSYAENAEGPLLKVAGMKATHALYSPDEAQLSRDPRLAPLVAESHANLPPTYIAVAQNDPLRDSGLAYAEALEAAGVEVELDRGEGLIHGYLRAMEYCEDSEAKLRAMATWLQQAQG
ncbi:alpha/beta hydrolase fold domain-containing protein [Oceanicola sp. 502str15]|uniref:alpha/beta hydrolase fold domain-containing protein n=1 Tax=Oceanicola sp. 502str15 TaxID=2696061 RepID=UPI0020941245|nr:alpha/beta hydrolase fold domain-containing protein [Oceanicola sp. 502str15]MCO6384399.1 alpha/beta hydrolase fold domain-containing protein [Oceanicola sp. 502str15]